MMRTPLFVGFLLLVSAPASLADPCPPTKSCKATAADARPLPAPAVKSPAVPLPTPAPKPADTVQGAQEPAAEPAKAVRADAAFGKEPCVEAAKLGIPRVTAELAHLAAPGVCVRDRRVSENGVNWRILVIGNPAKPGPLWVVPHNNEWVGFRTAAAAMAHYGGTIVAVESGGGRYFHGRDPNRNFARTADQSRHCQRLKGKLAPKYTAAVLHEWDRRQPIIGLHSNVVGGGSVSIKKRTDKEIPFPASEPAPLLTSDDTVVYIPRVVPPIENASDRDLIAWFTDAGINVIYEFVTPTNNDCSLSNYIALYEGGTYLNIDVPRTKNGSKNRPPPPDMNDAIQLYIVDRIMKRPSLPISQRPVPAADKNAPG